MEAFSTSGAVNNNLAPLHGVANPLQVSVASTEGASPNSSYGNIQEVITAPPMNKNYVPGLFPEGGMKFEDDQDPNVKIDIVRAFLNLYYPERGPTKKAKRSEFWALYETLVPPPLQLNQANVDKQISKYLAEAEPHDFTAVTPSLEMSQTPEGPKKRKRNTSVQEQSEKCWKGFAGPRSLVEDQETNPSSMLLRKLLKKEDHFSFSFDYGLLDNHVKKLKELSKPSKQEIAKANIYQDSTGYEVCLMIPGLSSKHDIKLAIIPGSRSWVVSGTIPAFNHKMPCISMEYPPGEFRREGKLPEYINIGQSPRKEYVNGILRLSFFAHNAEETRVESWSDDDGHHEGKQIHTG